VDQKCFTFRRVFNRHKPRWDCRQKQSRRRSVGKAFVELVELIGIEPTTS
jgi:hypothetical protein